MELAPLTERWLCPTGVEEKAAPPRPLTFFLW
jgi:hypothetical protein